MRFVCVSRDADTAHAWMFYCCLRGSDGQGYKKPRFFKAQPSGFFGGGFEVLLVFLDKQEKIGKIIQKLSSLKP